jgi:ATP-dependent Clp protease ATP-binding subunit ClpC
MTSNIQPETNKRLGFLAQDEKDSKDTSLDGIKHFFRSEFINRIDEQIVFRELGGDDVKKILKTILKEVCDDLIERYDATLKVTEEAEKFIAHKGYSPQYGVRELRRTVEKLVQIPLSNLILSGKFQEHSSWQVVCSNEGILIIPQ